MCNHTHQCHEHHDPSHNHSHNASPLIRTGISFLILLIGIFSGAQGLAKLAIFLAAYLIAGYDVLLSAIKNSLKGEVFDENFLMAIASAGAMAIREYPEAVMVMILYQIGEHLQHRAVEKSRHSITKLMDIRPDYANIEIDGKLKKTRPENVKINDIFVVQTGEKIPLDGTIIDGSASIDTAALTGESAPRTVKAGDEVISGCINLDGLLKIKAQKDFKDSTVSKILQLVENAGSKKTKSENFITKFAKVYTPAVCALALIIATIPPLAGAGSFSIWLARALTFLVISCPCALVISVPLSFFAGIGGAAKKGILFKGSRYVETLARTGIVVFDKTGTLTKGSFEVTKVLPETGFTDVELINLAAQAEMFSNHPVAVSLKQAAAIKPDSNTVKNVNEIAGKGVKAEIDTRCVLVGNEKLMQENNIIFSPAHDTAGTIVYTAINGKFAGTIIISDSAKPDSKAAINTLENNGIKTVMLTGDNKLSAQKTASELNIKNYYAELLPHKKVETFENIMTENKSGKSVVFAGDGINDAPVLTRADAGIAMGALGSDAAIEAADIVIMDDSPSKIPLAIKISQKTLTIAKQNITFAIGVKIIFLALGALGLITMWGAVFADTGVCLIAILNSLRALK